MTSKRRKIRYSDEELAFIRANCKLTRKELTDMFNHKFGRNLSKQNIAALCKRNGWYTGRTGQFSPGNSSWNKGKKGLRFKGSEKGWFKPGTKPPNTMPVGTEIFRYGWVKVKISEPNVWVSKARLVWQEYNGEIPEDMVVFHIDSDPTNNDISNLSLISRSEMAGLNNRGYHFEPEELRPVIILQEKLKSKIKEVTHENTN